MDYIFDESDVHFRHPNKAIEAPGTLTLRIRLRRGAGLNPKIHLYPDGGEVTEVSMVYDHVIGAYDVYVASIDFPSAGLYWYHFLISTPHNDVVTIPEHPGGGFQVTVYSAPEGESEWLKGGIIYHIFVDRFRNSGELLLKPGAIWRTDWGGLPHFLPDENGIVRNNDFFGGDLYGVLEKLPYLEELGVNCIYLSPVFESASNHKYDTGDFLKIDPSFGGDDALAELCAKASTRGIKVILDGVFNHVGSDSRYFNKNGTYDSLGAFQSEQSPYRSWFSFREDGSYESWWGIDLLPSVNEMDESYKEFICGEDGVLRHWMRKGVSGWRLDVVDELPDAFLDPLCNTIKSENPHSYIVGEVWEDASHKIAYGVRRRYLLGGQLDSVTNYPLKNAIISCVKEQNVEQLASTIASLCRNYPKPALNSLMNILGTHDTMRILTILGGSDFPDNKISMSNYQLSKEERKLGKKRLKLASLLQYTLPGIPCLYYGDEAGMEGGSDPFNRRCYPWGNEDHDLIEWFKLLARIRSEHSCFIEGKYELVQAHAGIYAFIRSTGASRVLIAVNISGDDRVVSVGEFNYNLLKEEFADDLTVKAGEPGIFSVKQKEG